MVYGIDLINPLEMEKKFMATKNTLADGKFVQ
jgi:hypothetical protein